MSEINSIDQIITENLGRLRQDLLGANIVQSVGCGCEGDQGCCQNRGCCLEACSALDPLDIVTNNPEVLREYIVSDKEPIKKFFKAKGIDINL